MNYFMQQWGWPWHKHKRKHKNIKTLLSSYAYCLRLACERRRISGCRFSYFSGGEKRQPEIRLRSQASLRLCGIYFQWGHGWHKHKHKRRMLVLKSNQIKSNNFIYTRFSHQYIFMNRNIYKTYNTMNLKLKTTNKLSSAYVWIKIFTTLLITYLLT